MNKTELVAAMAENYTLSEDYDLCKDCGEWNHVVTSKNSFLNKFTFAKHLFRFFSK